VPGRAETGTLQIWPYGIRTNRSAPRSTSARRAALAHHAAGRAMRLTWRWPSRSRSVSSAAALAVQTV
jgi:hypothetical protein